MASATFVRGASLDQEIEATFRALVGSIELPPDMAARVREIIAPKTHGVPVPAVSIVTRRPNERCS